MKKYADGAVVVIYNPEEKELINILDYAGRVSITLIIDNSLENHLNMLNQYINIDMTSVVYWHFPENIGLCKAMNKGLTYLYDQGCKWALTMNSDSHFKTDILKVFRKYLKKYKTNDIAILSPQFNYGRHPVNYYKGFRNRSWVMMSGNYVNLDVFVKVKGFFESFFVDGLDIEYCLRVRKKGYKIIECGEAILNHNPGDSKKLIMFGKTLIEYGVHSPRRYYYQGRSQIFIIKKYHTIHECKMFVLKLAKIIFFYNNKKTYIKEFARGVIDGIKLDYPEDFYEDNRNKGKKIYKRNYFKKISK